MFVPILIFFKMFVPILIFLGMFVPILIFWGECLFLLYNVCSYFKFWECLFLF